MMRCTPFRYVTPKTAAEAASALADLGPRAMVLAGGTDLVPNMKRRQQTPEALVALRQVAGIRGLSIGNDGALSIGAATTLSDIVFEERLPAQHKALFRAAAQVATPLIRTTATLGGNLCLDTRCNYYNQNYEWRQSISFCKKAPGPDATAIPKVAKDDDGVCWVAPSSKRCWAVSSTDSGPALLALGASVTFVSKAGERTITLDAMYRDDGMDYMTKRWDEVMTTVRVPAMTGWRSTYWKLRRRGSFDFPVLGVAAAVKLGKGGVVEDARIVLGAVASRPLFLAESASLVGKPLDDAAIARVAEAAAKFAKPLDNTDFAFSWRKKIAQAYVGGVLRELRGDDPATFGPLARHAARAIPVVG